MTEVEKEQELSSYIEEWSNEYYSKWKDFYDYVYRSRENGIYKLKAGCSLMDLLHSIMGRIEEYFLLSDEDIHLIPTKFASVCHLVRYLKEFKKFVCEYKHIIEENSVDGIYNDIIWGINEMIDQIELVADRCEKIYDHGEMPRPYQELRAKLLEDDIDGFVCCINDILKGVPYLIRKKRFNESHFHMMLQVLLMVLGFEPISEQTTSDGRIDMVVKQDDLTYIFEFKYTDNSELLADDALQQIKDKEYAAPYRLTSRCVIGVGVSFSGQDKNINDFKVETLFEKKIRSL